jgi:hypothetical protein
MDTATPPRFEVEVLKHALANTDKCSFNHSCLTGDPGQMCKAVGMMSNSILFVENDGEKKCCHKKVVNNSHICGCPLRKRYHRLGYI